LYTDVEYDTVTNFEALKREWESRVHNVLSAAGLSVPHGMKMISGGKDGLHTEELGRLLADMQYLQRTYPGVEW
jgi:ring-1,2-phenylacetyl-CoA epoxidase subunit PaaC